MNMMHDAHSQPRRVLAVGFNASESKALADGNELSFFADPEFSLLHRDPVGFDGAIIDQKQLGSLQYNQARYLVELTRKMPLLAYVTDAIFFDSRHCPCIPDGLIFRSRLRMLEKVCQLGKAGYWALPGQLEWQDLLLGKSRDDLCAGFGDVEWAFLNCLKDGLSNRQIAAKIELNISEVKVKLIELYRRLGVENRTQAAIVAFYLAIERE